MLTDIQDPATTTAGDKTVVQKEPATPTRSQSEVSLKESVPETEKPKILEEVVIEEVSIDGMCGVY